ncbi:MAG TPA: NAD(P)-dependent oxidoreductase, partial [Chthonomonadales bacterium]|nr:NAD(P)-dependent oxidoreductase [Chthonomonadales bacterium]
KLMEVPGVELVELEFLLRESDYVSIHAPSTPETRGMINRERLELMKPQAYLINTARGPLIDETALIEALENNTIAGAALDVYTEEPLPETHPIRRAPRCLLTPHNAFNAVEAAEIMSIQSAENVLEVMRGRRPRNVCNPAVWESPRLRVGGKDHEDQSGAGGSGSR